MKRTFLKYTIYYIIFVPCHVELSRSVELLMSRNKLIKHIRQTDICTLGVFLQVEILPNTTFKILIKFSSKFQIYLFICFKEIIPKISL